MAATAKRRKVDPSKIRKLHELLKLGMDDLRKQERAPKSKVNMWNWLQRNGVCEACLAGSVLRFTCGVKGSVFTSDGRDWMNALDNLKDGDVFWAAKNIGLAEVGYKFDRDVARYEDDRDQFWLDIEALYRDLKAADV